MVWFDDLADAKENAYFREQDKRLIEAMRTKDKDTASTDLSEASAPQGNFKDESVPVSAPKKEAASAQTATKAVTP